MDIDSFFDDAWRPADARVGDVHLGSAQLGRAPLGHDALDVEGVPAGQPWRVAAEVGDPRPRQAAYVVTIIVLALALTGAAVAYLLSARSGDAWKATAERRASDLASVELERDRAREQGLEAQAALVSAKEELADAVARLNEANDQVTTLTAEKATMLDKATFVPAAVAMATSLAQSISACAQQQQGAAAEPIGAGPVGEVGATVTAVAAPEVDNACDRARTESEAFTRWLGSR